MKSTKRGRTIIITLVLILMGIFIVNIWLVNKIKPEAYYVYHLKNDFKGCIYTLYNQEGEKELSQKDGFIHINADENGIVKTSSNFDFGIKDIESSLIQKEYVFENGQAAMEVEELGIFEEKINGNFFYTVSRINSKEECSLDFFKK